MLAAGGLAGGSNGGNGGVGGLLGGLVGGGSNGGGSRSGGSVINNTDVFSIPVPVPTPMPITEHQYYEDTIGQMGKFFDYAQGVGQRICDLEQRVAVDETSIAKNFEFMSSQNEWQNKFFDEKMRYADLLEQCRIQNATCKCIKGEVYASPADLADPYVGRKQVLGSYTEPYCATNYNGCNGWNGFGNGCGC